MFALLADLHSLNIPAQFLATLHLGMLALISHNEIKNSPSNGNPVPNLIVV